MKKNTELSTKKKFKLFDSNRDGKGVYEQENRKPTLKFFFILVKRKFTQLLQLNLLMLFMVIPFLVSVEKTRSYSAMRCPLNL